MRAKISELAKFQQPSYQMIILSIEFKLGIVNYMITSQIHLC